MPQVDFFRRFGYNINKKLQGGAGSVHRRILAAVFALLLLLAPAALTEDDEELEFDDDPGGFEYFNDLSGFEERNFNVENGDYTYQLTEDEEGAFIVKYHGPEAEVKVPDHMEEYPVVAIGDHAFEDFAPNILSIELPAGITWIGVQAFATCDKLTSIVIPDGVTKLDDRCFLGCKSLESITLPDSITEVGDMAFAVCMNLKEITFGPNVESIGANAFQACQSLERVTVPAGTEIGDNAFLACSPDLEIIRN